jgi:hypothetical protein
VKEQLLNKSTRNHYTHFIFYKYLTMHNSLFCYLDARLAPVNLNTPTCFRLIGDLFANCVSHCTEKLRVLMRGLLTQKQKNREAVEIELELFKWEDAKVSNGVQVPDWGLGSVGLVRWMEVYYLC